MLAGRAEAAPVGCSELDGMPHSAAAVVASPHPVGLQRLLASSR